MILGIGVDIVQKDRMAQIVKSTYANKLYNRLLLDHEIAMINDNKLGFQGVVALCAKRFAAKEAFAKAIGYGIGRYIGFTDIKIEKDNQGAPYVTMIPKIETIIRNKFQERLGHTKKDKGKIVSHISISDEKEYAVATAIIEIV